jgi:alpha-galactosidase
VQEGDLYRLLAPGAGSLSANQYVSRDGKQAVLFAFLHAQQYGRQAPAIHLKGLAEQGLYRVQVVEGGISETAETLSGAYLMSHGLTPVMKGEFDAAAVVLERLDK